ncbi:hypothetical protein EST38_g11486 [Candolleomyces aberdarensis]|uniref:DUF6535 domain-containing protein n=1 Tax=Candolleomyces aberdarensis TaxID=2316362 RepID=A0A4V1Q2A1_9AGAR|nr:hypothetical protein EST38_g11486 [Candolleomyces aberdarensis]
MASHAIDMVEPTEPKITLDPNRNSKIWDLYLEDAEQAAKDRVELMKSGLLDSVLIFAGLFAGVVSSFIIDARRDIQENSEQNLLGDIRDHFRGFSIVNVVHSIPAAANCVSVLWHASLYLTLFSALMGILAKTWLANLVPTSTKSKRKPEDAYRRHRLDMESSKYLQPAIILMFLLVQIASLFFLIGLIIQSITDEKILGYVTLAFVVLGAVIYGAVTSLPHTASLSSLRNPLSDLIQSLKIVLGQTLQGLTQL